MRLLSRELLGRESGSGRGGCLPRRRAAAEPRRDCSEPKIRSSSPLGVRVTNVARLPRLTAARSYNADARREAVTKSSSREAFLGDELRAELALQGGEPLHDLGIELRARATEELAQCLLAAESRRVGSLRGHGVKGVTDGDDARPQGDREPLEPVRVAGTVPALVCRAKDLRGKAERGRSGEDPLADQRVPFHEPPLVVR